MYIKTHNITGLKYFGKTTKKNVNQYRGSGLYWKNHIKYHGYDVTTKIVAIFDNAKLCEEFAIKFSIENNIVNSIEWANLILENGNTGGVPGTYLTDDHKRKLSEANKGKSFTLERKRKISKAGRGRIHSLETIEKIRLANTGQKRSDEFRENVSKKKKNIIFTDNHKEKLSKAHTGKTLSEETKNKIRNYNKGRPKNKICRIFDKKEMAVNNFKVWENLFFRKR